MGLIRAPEQALVDIFELFKRIPTLCNGGVPMTYYLLLHDLLPTTYYCATPSEEQGSTPRST